MLAWTLVFHIIGLVFWLGSLLIVTRVLAMHVEETSAEARATLSRLESRLLKGFAHPGAALVVISGFILIAQDPSYVREHWLHAKLLLVVILVALDLRVTFRAKAFQDGTSEMSRGECMALHGAIALVFFAIVILALVKPFGSSHRHARRSEPSAWATGRARCGQAENRNRQHAGGAQGACAAENLQPLARRIINKQT